MRDGKEVRVREIHSVGTDFALFCIEDSGRRGAIRGRRGRGLAWRGNGMRVPVQNSRGKQSFAMIKRNYMTKVVVA
jgi:hypothetical protein